MKEYIVMLERVNPLTHNAEIISDHIKASSTANAKNTVHWIYGVVANVLFIEEWDFENDHKYDQIRKELRKSLETVK